MRNSDETKMTAQSVLMQDPCAYEGPPPMTAATSVLSAAWRAPDSGIRAERVEAARARLAAGALPISAEALADVILRHAAHARRRD